MSLLFVYLILENDRLPPEEVMKLTFNQLDIRSNSDYCSVLLTNKDESAVMVITKDFHSQQNYLEWNDQSNSVYEGMASAHLDGNEFFIHLNEKGKDHFGKSDFQATLSFPQKDYDQFLPCLKDIFGGNLSLTRKTYAGGEAPKKKYETIKYLNLSGKKLKLPPDDLHLHTSLEKLFILDNPNLDLEATFLALPHLPALKKLHISIHGKIPALISKLTSLEQLHIEGKPDLSSLPEDIGKLCKLDYLYLQSTEEIHLPAQFSDLQSLKTLHIRAKRWTLPAAFYNLTNLTTLDLYTCDLKDFPGEIVKMTNLESITVGFRDENSYGDILRKLGNVESLRSLEINVVGEVRNLGACKQIEQLTIYSKGAESMVTFDESFCQLKKLKSLHFSQCHLLEFPDCLEELTSLSELSFEDCEFLSMPISFSKLKNLQTLNLSNCPQMATIPPEMGRLTSLKALNMFDLPNLKSLPEEMNALTNLEEIEIPDYQDIQNIPAHWMEFLV